MRIKNYVAYLSFAALVSPLAALHARADETGVHCDVDAMSFEADADTTRVDYLVLPGGKAPRFRLLAGHINSATGPVSIELKAQGVTAAGTTSLSLVPAWKSVLKLPQQKVSAVGSGEFTFTHFEPHGDLYAEGSAQFQTVDGHHGQCRFRVRMQVVDLGNFLR